MICFVIMNDPERRCRKRKGTYSKVGNVFAVLAALRGAAGRGRRGPGGLRGRMIHPARGPSLIMFAPLFALLLFLLRSHPGKLRHMPLIIHDALRTIRQAILAQWNYSFVEPQHYHLQYYERKH